MLLQGGGGASPVSELGVFESAAARVEERPVRRHIELLPLGSVVAACGTLAPQRCTDRRGGPGDIVAVALPTVKVGRFQPRPAAQIDSALAEKTCDGDGTTDPHCVLGTWCLPPRTGSRPKKPAPAPRGRR